MFRDRLIFGTRAGILAAVITIGAFVGLGLRAGRAFGHFSDFGRELIPTPDGLIPLPWLALASGLVVHTFWLLLWGGVFAVLTHAQSLLRTAIAALSAGAVLVFLLLPRWPALLGVVGRVDLTGPQRWFIVILISSALFAGRGARQVSAS